MTGSDDNDPRTHAGEYVLGSLDAGQRAQFERELAQDPALRAEVRAWERRLAPLHATFTPQAPREVVWAAIDRAIHASRANAPARPGAGVDLWRVWALAASIASVALTTALVREMHRPPQVIREQVRVEVPVTQYVAMLQPGAANASYLVAMMPDKGLMKVSLTGSYPMDYKNSCLELWVLDDAGKPHSLGVLPEGEGEMAMPLPKDMPMPRKPMLAVSMEPRGGSPTGTPTGPVLTTGRALRSS